MGSDERLSREQEHRRLSPTSDDSEIATRLVREAHDAEREGRFDAAEARLVEAVERFTRAHGEDDARTRHAFYSIGRVRHGAGRLRGALEIYEQCIARGHGAATSLTVVVEDLRRALGDEDGAARARDAMLASARRDLRDPMLHSESIVRVARRLAEAGGRDDAITLLEDALAGVDAIERGARISPSARVPAQVRAELVEAREAVRGT